MVKTNHNIRYSKSIVFLDYPKANIYNNDNNALMEMAEILDYSKFMCCVCRPEFDYWITSDYNPSRFRSLLRANNRNYDSIYYVNSSYVVINAVAIHRNFSPFDNFVLVRDSLLFNDGQKEVLSGLGLVSNNIVIGVDSRDNVGLFYLWKLSKLFDSEISFVNIDNASKVEDSLNYFEYLKDIMLENIYGGIINEGR